jgi:hypothetical protein
MPSERKWHSVNIVSTSVAVLAVCFAGLQWRTTEQQRADARRMHEAQMRQEGERLRSLAADYQAALAKRDMAYTTALKELDTTNRTLTVALREKERLIEVLSQELRAQRGDDNIVKPSPPSSPLQRNLQPLDPILRAKTEILGKWRSLNYKSHTVEFFVDGSMVQSVPARDINGTYIFIDDRRLKWRSAGLLWGENVFVFEFSFRGDRLILKMPKGQTLEYIRLSR